MDIRSKLDPAYGSFGMMNFASYEEFRKRTDIDFFGWADPFFPDPSVPESVKKGIMESLETNAAHYTLPIGDIKMREAVAKRVKKLNGIDVDPNKNIVITSGSDISFNYAMRPFLVPGEENEVLVPTPSYGSNFDAPNLMGGKAIAVPTKAEDNYDLDIEEFKKRLTEKTKIVAITNPNNPTTTVYKKETLEKLAQFVIENDLILFVDQCFEDLCFEGNEMFNIINLPGMFERTILVSSFSKAMGLCGIRLAYIVAHEDIMSVLYGCAVFYIGAPSTIAQWGIMSALEDTSFVDEYRKEFQKRGYMAYDLLKDVPNIECSKPESGFYLWLDTHKLGTPNEVCDYLMATAKVAVTAGNMYGPEGMKGIRIVYGSGIDGKKCEEVMKRIRQALLDHPKNQG